LQYILSQNHMKSNPIMVVPLSLLIEFDFTGVIIGPDLKYGPVKDQLYGDITQNSDPTLKRDSPNFFEYVRNIYRVLLSRGMRGCYVYFVDKETEAYFRERMEG
jgi:uncharacterized protein